MTFFLTPLDLLTSLQLQLIQFSGCSAVDLNNNKNGKLLNRHFYEYPHVGVLCAVPVYLIFTPLNFNIIFFSFVSLSLFILHFSYSSNVPLCAAFLSCFCSSRTPVLLFNVLLVFLLFVSVILPASRYSDHVPLVLLSFHALLTFFLYSSVLCFSSSFTHVIPPSFSCSPFFLCFYSSSFLFFLLMFFSCS